jgi:hypothetical protein
MILNGKYVGITGIISYCKNGDYHREDGPAYEEPNGYRAWWLNGKRHRIDGPARIYGDDHIWALWCDGQHWEHIEEETLEDIHEDEWEDWFVGFSDYEKAQDGMRLIKTGKFPKFQEDMIGDSNKELVEKFFNNPELAKQCHHHIFEPDNFLGDAHRLEVITTPEDDVVVGWTVFVD